MYVHAKQSVNLLVNFYCKTNQILNTTSIYV